MKILFISMPTIHVIRWIENLDSSNYELYWFDIMDRGNILIKDDFKITKIINWKKRKIRYIKGEHLLYKNAPKVYKKIQPYIEVTISEKLEEIIQEIKPDLIHSFEMQYCSYSILKTMSKYKKIKWLYSCWGSDLFYYKNFRSHKKKLEKVLNRINYLHTDCLRDYNIAKSLGFKGEHIGVIPGGTGFKIEALQKYKQSINDRNIILVKGYNHIFGKAINVLKALKLLSDKIANYQVVVFAAHKKTIEYIRKENLKFKIYTKDSLKHDEVLSLMGKSKFYIGNNISDGMPNTLLEAIVMNAFPIQSNPGGATKEIIKHKINGLIIENPNDINEIKTHIFNAINLSDKDLDVAANINSEIANERLDFEYNRKKILNSYKMILK